MGMKVVDEQQLERALEALPAPAGGELRVVASGNLATPRALLDSLERVRERYRLFMLAAHDPLPQREGVIFETPFVGPATRDTGGRLDYLPMRLSLVPRLFATLRPPDVALVHTSMPRNGKVSLGIEVNILVAAIEHVRSRGGLVIAQLNPEMPYTLGDGEIDEDLIDLAIEAPEPLTCGEPDPRPVSEHAERIAEFVAELVGDRATLQLGIGQVPDATLRALRGRRGLSIWSEMISDGVLGLERAGALASAEPIVCSFMFGTRELYDWVDRNPRVQMKRTETANDPSLIALRPGMVSVNTALQVDLKDQANASHIGERIYSDSGFGGQPDFVSGALHSPGGQAVIALRSWHERSGTSTIVPRLNGPVTSFQHSAVVTEHGCAHIFGRSQRAQTHLMIEHTAHPDAREWLRGDPRNGAPRGAHDRHDSGDDDDGDDRGDGCITMALAQCGESRLSGVRV
jgi:acyl-CoA hydrolase